MAYVDAAPARDHLRALAACGFPLSFLTDRIGMPRGSLSAIRRGERPRTNPYVVRSINRLHRELAGTTPGDHGIPEGPVAWTRVIAARNGWTTAQAGRPEAPEPTRKAAV
jgi:hypothetical protein